MIEYRTNGRTVAALSMLLLSVLALALIPAMDADGGQQKDIYVTAGAAYEYDGVPVEMEGYDIVHWELSGDLKDSFVFRDGKLTGTIPRDAQTGVYTLILESIGVKYHQGTPSESVVETKFNFHVTALDLNYQTGDETELPKILSISISHVGNNGLYAMIKVVTENANKITFDYNDGITMEPLTLTTDTITSAHRYAQNGIYNVTVTVYNDVGSAQKVFVYDGQGYANEVVVPAGEDGEKDMTFFWASLVLTVLAGIAFFFTRHPYALAAAVLLAAVTVAIYIF